MILFRKNLDDGAITFLLEIRKKESRSLNMSDKMI